MQGFEKKISFIYGIDYLTHDIVHGDLFTAEDKITEGLIHVFHNHCGHNRTLQNIVTTIKARQGDLFNYFCFKDCPRTTNIIESYNSHFQGRLKSIRSFQSFKSARRWLNAYIIRRRTKKFTDCKGKIKKLNKHAALELTIKKQAPWPDVLKDLGISKVNYFDFDENFPEKTV